MPIQKIVLVTPVFNDWESLAILAGKLTHLPELQPYEVTLVAVDDGSINVVAPPVAVLSGCLRDVIVLRLNSNLGHQRAIALGLAHVHATLSPDLVIVMDSDGEDSPEAIGSMLEAHLANPGALIAAQRVKRSEGFLFRTFYQLYKMVFRFLTGRPISFGNFSVIPAARVPNLLFNSGIWNNFAATVMKCRVPLVFVPTIRGKRYAGESKMNFTSLLIHGFSAISVFTDVVIGRILSMLVGLIFLTASAVIIVVWLKFFTNAFVPGYATNVILFLVSTLLTALFTGFLLVLSLLATRERSSALPSELLKHHLREVRHLRALQAVERSVS